MSTSHTFGVKRTIERPGRASYDQIEELICPCCGQSTRVEFEQSSGIPDRPPITLTHCTHRGCRAYYMTHTVDIFFDHFGLIGSDSDNSPS